MEMESENAIAFLDVLVTRKETTLATKVYRKPTHTGRYLNFNSNLPPHVKRGLIQRVFTVELPPPYVRNDKIWLKKSAA
jgi:hypothetical protein